MTMNTSELLHTIAQDRIEGMMTIDSYQLKPVILQVSQPEMLLSLNNDMLILNTKQIPGVITEIELISSDNVFTSTPAEYDLMDEFRYQVFTDYLEIITTADSFQPYRLEFVKIIPHRKQ